MAKIQGLTVFVALFTLGVYSQKATAQEEGWQCGPGTYWDDLEGQCLPEPSLCQSGTYWDEDAQGCLPDLSCFTDLNNDGVTGVVDLLIMLSAFGFTCDQATPIFACGQLVQFHGYSYETIEVGGRCWFAENLRSQVYTNGDSIPTAIAVTDWNGFGHGACDPYGHSESNAAVFGMLYNGHAVSDARGLCPTNWHVSSDYDWKQLEIELGMTDSIANLSSWRGTLEGSRLKALPNAINSWNGTDSIGFAALPGGFRNENGTFSGLGEIGAFWTSTGTGCCYRQYRLLRTSEDRIFRNNLYYYFFGRATSGLSVRCVKN
ncbi:MAG: fibrobacter succinogenes major paralogous domain-containing protein [Bacteroidetes bacterium]|nr:fibrobacter succinogenes major paralogous domain-containing protein [Bacteroidota bacterium]